MEGLIEALEDTDGLIEADCDILSLGLMLALSEIDGDREILSETDGDIEVDSETDSLAEGLSEFDIDKEGDTLAL
jgi:hypothetical protein